MRTSALARMLRNLTLVLGMLSTFASAASAEMMIFEGTLSVEGPGTPAVIDTAVGVATINGVGVGPNITALAIPSGLFSIMSTVIPTTSTLITEFGFDLTAGAGAFTAATPTAPLGGPLPVPGDVRVCLLTCAIELTVPLTQGGTRGVGLGGPPIMVTGVVTLSLQGAEWDDQTTAITTTPTGTVMAVFTAMGFAHGPASNTGTTALTSGVVQLVTPVRVTAPLVGVTLPNFGSLNIRFLPEPGLFLLFGTGAAGLVLLGRLRR